MLPLVSFSCFFQVCLDCKLTDTENPVPQNFRKYIEPLANDEEVKGLLSPVGLSTFQLPHHLLPHKWTCIQHEPVMVVARSFSCSPMLRDQSDHIGRLLSFLRSLIGSSLLGGACFLRKEVEKTSLMENKLGSHELTMGKEKRCAHGIQSG